MSSLDPRTEPLRLALTRLAEVRGTGEECPDAETLWRSAAGEIPADEEPAVILHIGECTACGVAWELARDLSPVEEPAARRSPRLPGWATLAAAAVVILAVTAMFLWMPGGDRLPSAPAYRDSGSNWLASKLAEELPLARDGLVLRWTAGPEGTTYDVVVTDASLQPVTSSVRLSDPELPLEPDALTAIGPNGRILWRVTAHLPDGETAVSMTFINILE